MGTGLGFDRKDTFADKTVLSLAALLIANGTTSDETHADTKELSAHKSQNATCTV